MAKDSEKDQTTRQLPWGYAGKIARVTGYSVKTVYAVAQGRHSNEIIQGFIDLAHADRLQFAHALERELQAKEILNSI